MVRGRKSELGGEKYYSLLVAIKEAGSRGVYIAELSYRTKIPESTIRYWLSNHKEYFKNVDVQRDIPPSDENIVRKRRKGKKAPVVILRLKGAMKKPPKSQISSNPIGVY
jgi:hypothetical protein